MLHIGFFYALSGDASHYLHACALVSDIRTYMPDAWVVHLTDAKTPAVIGVDQVQRGPGGPLLEQRLRHYASLEPQDWLLLDTDVSVRANIMGLFDDRCWDVAVCDRNWAHLPQGERMMHDMPFNTGVVGCRTMRFWRDVLDVWRAYPEAAKDWMSEQRAVYDVVRRGHYSVKILPGAIYNYPPKHVDDVPPVAALLHWKGNRKAWLSDVAYRTMSAPRTIRVRETVIR